MQKTLYRGLSKKDHSEETIFPLKTKRVPSNIPYLVDNIWEWLRPEDMPSRRFSTYASPQLSLANKYANDNSVVCTIEFCGKYKAVQLVGYEDAKLHSDIKYIQFEIFQALGQIWTDSNLEDKLKFGLFLPSLEKHEVESIFKEFKMEDVKKQLIENCSFWKTAKHINKMTHELTDGEVFFHASDGYKLKKL
jgi:hypothetical protein